MDDHFISTCGEREMDGSTWHLFFPFLDRPTNGKYVRRETEMKTSRHMVKEITKEINKKYKQNEKQTNKISKLTNKWTIKKTI